MKVHNVFEFSNDDILIHTERNIYQVESLEYDNVDLKKIYTNTSDFNIKKINNEELIIYSNENSFIDKIISNQKFCNIQSIELGKNILVNDISNFKGAYYISTNSGIFKANERINNLSKPNQDLLR